MDPTLNLPTVYFIDSASIERIKRLVKSMMKSETRAMKRKQNQQGAGLLRARKRLTDRPYQSPISLANPLWDDPVRLRLMLAGQSTGTMAIERLNALLKIRADHLNRQVPLPRGWSKYSLNAQINQILKLYKKEIELSAFPMNNAMTREEAISILNGVKGLPNNVNNLLAGQQQLQAQRQADIDLMTQGQGNLQQAQQDLLQHQIGMQDTLEGLDQQFQQSLLPKAQAAAAAAKAAASPIPPGPRTRSRTKKVKL